MRVADLLGETVSGTRDGGALARNVEERLKQSEGDITIDFAGVECLSFSAGCAFWQVLAARSGVSVVGRLLFQNVSDCVAEGLLQGMDCLNPESDNAPR